jgi:lipopolysaccharide transport system ATP-binding protein
MDNIFFNLSIQGYSQQAIQEKLNEIVAFADIGEFVYQPVKLYSSGMYVRLAFSIAINKEPEILIIDEALSVGDEAFQRKCYAKIESIKQKGTTILFVSHSAAAVIEFCDRAILLDSSEKLMEGVPKKVVGIYQKLLYATIEQQNSIKKSLLSEGAAQNLDILPALDVLEKKDQRPAPDTKTHIVIEDYFDASLVSKSVLEYASKGVEIEGAVLFTTTGERVNCINRGRRYRLVYTVYFSDSAEQVRFGTMIKTLSGFELGGYASSSNADEKITYIPAGSKYEICFEFDCNLNPGTFFFNAGVLGLVNQEETYLHRVLDILLFRVLPLDKNNVTGRIDFGFSSMTKQV